MKQCISRHPSAQLTLLGTRIGAKAAKAVLMSAAAGRLTPEILSEALQSSSTIRGHVQREAVKLLVVRVGLRTPQQLQWLVRLVGDCVGGLSLTGAITSLTQRSLLYQVANFGLRGSAASAITTAAVQVGLTTCTLVTTNAAFWRRGDHKMTIRQYRYELLTSVYTGMGSIAGGAAGAAVGSLVMPGVGTAFGSVLCSVGGGYVPGYLRDKRGPDDRRRQQAVALRAYAPLRMQDTQDGAVLMYKEELREMTAVEREAVAPASVGESAAGLSISPSSEAESVSSADEVNTEEGEVVWLDFVRATTPTHESNSQSASEAPAAASHVSSLASVSTSLSVESESGSEHASHLKDGSAGEAGVRSFLRFSPAAEVPSQNTEAPTLLSAASSFADLDDGSEGRQGRPTSAATARSRVERFQGHAKYITVSTVEELEAEVAKFGGEDDLMLVFAEGKAA